MGSSRKVCCGLSLPCAPLVVPAPHTPPGPSAVHPVSIPASTAENHTALLCHRAGSLPHRPTRGARGRRGRHAAAQRRAEHGVGRVLVPCGRMLGQPQVRRRCRRARRSCAAQSCMRPQYTLDGLGPPLACVVEWSGFAHGRRPVVLRRKGRQRGHVSSGPCVVRVVSVLTMQSCMLVGMDVISLPKVAVARAYRLGGFREVSEFVLRS